MSSGKLPTYILQAHPAIALIAGYMIAHALPQQRFERLIWRMCLWLPGILLLTVIYLIISEIELSLAYYAPLIIGMATAAYWTKNLSNLYQQVLMIWSMSAALMVVVFLGLMPWFGFRLRRFSMLRPRLRQPADELLEAGPSVGDQFDRLRFWFLGGLRHV